MSAEKTTEKMVAVYIPPESYDGQKSVFVGVNGRSYQVMTGKTVEVPLAVAEVLDNARAAQGLQRVYLSEKQSRD